MADMMMLIHGTKLMQLKPSSVLQTAENDLRLRDRRKEDKEERSYYAFHRVHVRKAERALDLIRLAIGDLERGRASGKRNTRIIYEDEAVLIEALKLAEAGA